MLASYILGKARILLNDPDAVRWTDADLLGWLNGAQRQIVAVRPDSNSKKADLITVDGIEQTIPADGTRLLSVLHNVGGRVITLVSRDSLNNIDPNWIAAQGRWPSKHYVFDQDAPKSFELYPPALAGKAVRINYAALPAELTSTGSAIALDDIYEGPLIDWVCYRAWSEDADGANQQDAAGALAVFMQALTGKTQSDKATEPKRK